MDNEFKTEINRTPGSDTIQGQLTAVTNRINTIQIPRFLNLANAGLLRSGSISSSSSSPTKVYLTNVLNNNAAQLANIPTSTIEQVQLTIYNNAETGDIAYTTIRARGVGMNNYIRVYNSRLDTKGSTAFIGPANTFTITPIRDANGELYVEFYRTGASPRMGIDLTAITYNESVAI